MLTKYTNLNSLGVVLLVSSHYNCDWSVVHILQNYTVTWFLFITDFSNDDINQTVIIFLIPKFYNSVTKI